MLFFSKGIGVIILCNKVWKYYFRHECVCNPLVFYGQNSCFTMDCTVHNPYQNTDRF